MFIRLLSSSLAVAALASATPSFAGDAPWSGGEGFTPLDVRDEPSELQVSEQIAKVTPGEAKPVLAGCDGCVGGSGSSAPAPTAATVDDDPFNRSMDSGG